MPVQNFRASMQLTDRSAIVLRHPEIFLIILLHYIFNYVDYISSMRKVKLVHADAESIKDKLRLKVF